MISAKKPKTRVAHLLIIVLLGFFIYANTIPSQFQLDDYPHIVDNSSIKAGPALEKLWNYWPSRFFGFLTLSWNYSWGRLNVSGYHLVNIGIHLLSAVAIYLLIADLDRERKRGDFYPELAFWTALLFVSHPAQTQAVTYLIQRCASLAFCCCFWSLFCYLQARRRGPSWSRSRLFYYFAGIVLAVLGMLSKETAAVLPVAILGGELIADPRRFLSRRARLFMLPYLLLIMVVPTLVFYTSRHADPGNTLYYAINTSSDPARLRITAQDLVIESRGDYILTQLNAIRTYLRLVFLPLRQKIYYDLPVSRSLFENNTSFSFLVIVSLILVGIRLCRRKKILAGGIFWFFLALLPTSFLAVIWPLISEHHLYGALLGGVVFPAYLICRLEEIRGRRAVVPWAWILVFLMMTLTIQRNFAWWDQYTLWKAEARRSPRSASAHNNLAAGLIQKGRFREAIESARKAMKLNPLLDAYHNLWAAYYNQGDNETAERIAREHLKRTRRKEALLDLALTLIKAKKYPEAKKCLEEILVKHNRSYRAQFQLGMISYLEQKYDSAILHLEETVTINPDYIPAYNYLGLSYTREGNSDQAERSFQNGLKLKPKSLELNYNLARLYWSRKRYSQARKYLRESSRLALDPPVKKAIQAALDQLSREEENREIIPRPE